MDAASASPAPPLSPEAKEPAINWALLRRLAAGKVVKTGVEAKDEGQDAKPSRIDTRTCMGCGVKYPGSLICGYCRGRVAELRATAGGRA